MRLVLGVLAARHQRRGLVERVLERGAAGERVLEEGLAEPGELTVVLAAKGGVRGIGCGNDRRGVALELVEKDTRVARRHHHHAPADLGIIERLAQIRGRQLRERQRAVLDLQPVRRAVRGEEQHQHIVVRMHARGEQLQRLGESRDARQRIRIAVLHVVHQQHRALARAEALGEHPAGKQRLALEHRLLAITGEADEVDARLARWRTLHARDGGGDLRRLVVEQGLRLIGVIRLLGLLRLLCHPQARVEVQEPHHPGRGEHQRERDERRAGARHGVRRAQHAHAQQRHVNECQHQCRDRPRLHQRAVARQPEDSEHERCDRQRRHQQRAGIGRAAVRARHHRAGPQRQQQIAAPAEEPIQSERRMCLGVQGVQPDPHGEVEDQQRDHLVEVHDEARRPAAPQRQQRKAAAQVACQACEQPGRRRGGRCRGRDRTLR